MTLAGFSKYFSPKKYFSRFMVIFNRMALHRLDLLVAPAAATSFQHPPIFILGAPRCGSTLIYQVITEAFELSYLSNLHCMFFGAPSHVEKVVKKSKNVIRKQYSSHHGETDGWMSPSECGNWWYRFFRRKSVYVALDEIDDSEMKEFRRSLLALTRAASRPVVFKNLYASMRLKAITKYIPEALIVVIDRNELDQGQSLLESRFKVFGDYSSWWSVPLPNVEVLETRPAHIQVVDQIRGVMKIISADLRMFPSDQVHRLNYEQFCNDTHAELSKLESFFLKNSCSCPVDLTGVPATFDRKNNCRIDKDVYLNLQTYLDGDV
jgi:hypothetical protein